jgi:hypothetical protein
MPNNRRSGHVFEREIVNVWKALGYSNTCTSRSESKSLDDDGVDLCFTQPFAIQCKRTVSQPNFRALINGIEKNLKKRSDWAGAIPVVYHKRKGEKPTVTLAASDFEELIQTMKTERILK